MNIVPVLLVKFPAVVVAAIVVVDVTNGEAVDCAVPLDDPLVPIELTVDVLTAGVPLVPTVVPAVVPGKGF